MVLSPGGSSLISLAACLEGTWPHRPGAYMFLSCMAIGHAPIVLSGALASVTDFTRPTLPPLPGSSAVSLVSVCLLCLTSWLRPLVGCIVDSHRPPCPSLGPCRPSVFSLPRPFSTSTFSPFTGAFLASLAMRSAPTGRDVFFPCPSAASSFTFHVVSHERDRGILWFPLGLFFLRPLIGSKSRLLGHALVPPGSLFFCQHSLRTPTTLSTFSGAKLSSYGDLALSSPSTGRLASCVRPVWRRLPLGYSPPW